MKKTHVIVSLLLIVVMLFTISCEKDPVSNVLIIDCVDVSSIDTEKIYTVSDTVTLKLPEGITLRYTTDGSNPTASSTAAVSGSIPFAGLAGNVTVKVIAEKGGVVSDVVSFIVKVKPSVTFDKAAAAELGQSDRVTVTVASGVTVYYTTDGSTPTTATTTTGTEISLSECLGSTTIKILAVKDGVQSTGELSVYVKLPSPTVSADESRIYEQTEKITVTVPAGSTVRYTTDGTEPTATTGTEYSDGIPLSGLCGNVFIKAVIVKDSECSAVKTVTVKVRPAAVDTSSVDKAKEYSVSDTITLSSASGTTIHYTTDNSTPTAASEVATSGSIPLAGLAGQVTVKVVAEKDGIVSDVSSFTVKVKPSIVFDKAAAAELGQSDRVTVTVASGVTVYYTTDGSTPTTATTTTGTEISLSECLGSTTIKILAVKDGVQSTGELSVYVKLPSPTVSADESRIYEQTEKITVTVPAGSTVRYTTDGTEPTATTGTEYSDGIPLSGLCGNVFIKAVIVKDSECSAVKTVTVKVRPAAVDTSSVDKAKEYSVSDTITLSSASGTTIHYTTDNSTPTAASEVATSGSIPLAGLAGQVTVKVVAEKDGIVSDVSSFTVKVKPSVAFDKKTGAELGQDESVTVTVASGVSVYYTTNGEEATTSSTPAANGAIPLTGLSGNTVIKILAVKDGIKTTSNISVYVKLSAPTISVENNKTYSQSETITVTVPEGASLRYTTDGTVPTATMGTGSSGDIPLSGLSGSVTLKAVLVKDGKCSDTATVNVSVKPVLSYTPRSSSYSENEKITFEGLADGTVIYYTLNGATPTTACNREEDGKSLVLNVSLDGADSKDVTVKAIAVKDGISSDVITFTVTIRNSFVVTYNLKNGTAAEGVQTTANVTPGGTLTLLTADKVSYTGYTFDGWYEEDGTYYEAGGEITVNESLTLVANWLDDNLEYTANGETVSVKMKDSARTTAESVVISEKYQGKNVADIAEYAFCNGEDAGSIITEITIPKTVKTIGNGAFAFCSKLAKVIIPEGSSLETIGQYSFYGCTNLETVEIPSESKLNTIDDSAFYVCLKLSKIKLPASLKKIGNDAFSSCVALTSDILAGTSVEKIGKNAFNDTEITTITIPASVEEIGESAFKDCGKLKTVTFENGKLQTLPESLFENCYILEGVIIPASVVTIGRKAFYNCYGLETVTFDYTNGKLETICEDAFGHNIQPLLKAITQIDLPGTVKNIGAGAFELFCGENIHVVVHIYGSEDTVLAATKSSWFSTTPPTGFTYTVTWEDSIKVTYVYNNGSADSVCNTKENAAMTKPSDPEKVGYFFWKWTTDAEGKNGYDFSQPVVNDITLYAQWRKAYSIGETGPGGGIIFHDVDADNGETYNDGLESATCGWKYLEIAPTDANGGNAVVWSTSSVSIEDTENEFSAAYSVTYTTLADTIYSAAAAARSYSTDKAGSGWYLPTYQEMNLLVKAIAKHNFSVSEFTSTEKRFWTSTYKKNPNEVYIVKSDGTFNTTSAYTCDKYYVRPVRRVMLEEL